MDDYGRVSSIPGRLARWTAKLLVVNAALTGAAGYGLHRAFPARTEAAWRAFWGPPAACAVPAAKDPAQAAEPKPKAGEAAAKPKPGSGSEVTVYGRDACGITTAMRKAMTQSGVPFRYAQIDDPAMSAEVGAKLSKIGHSGGYGLPVVSVGDTVQIRPAPDAVAELYRKSK